MSYIVVEDTQGTLAPGHMLSNAEGPKLGSRRGLTIMPAHALTFSGGALAGYFKREFGAGHPLPNGFNTAAKLALFLGEGEVMLHWRARLRLVPGSVSRAGALRLASDTSQNLPSCGVVSAQQVNLVDLRDEDSTADGWVVGGTARARATMQGVFGFALHGHGAGYRLQWAAISQE